MGDNSHSHPLLPGPRPPADFLPASYPPAPRRWSGQTPVSQSRGGYISPDPSPTSEDVFQHQEHQAHRRSLPVHPNDYFGYRAPIRDEPPRTLAPNIGLYKGDASEVDPFYYPMMPPQHQPQRHSISAPGKRRGSRKADGKQPTFLTKLYQILEQPEYHHIIRWDEAGEVIIIEKPDELADKILPLVYRQSRFASFSRQLNIYGFMRKVSLRHVDRGICDPDASTWSHPFLRRASSAAEIQGFKRRVPPRPSQAMKRRASIATTYHDDHSVGLSPSSSEGSYSSPPDPYQHYLLPDLDEEKPIVFKAPHHSVMAVDAASPESGQDYETHSNRGYPFGLTIAGRPIPHPNLVPPTITHHISAFNYEKGPPSGGVPASAPANINNFPQGLHRISQGHIRTRSVQGEPPSATLFSPTSPLAQPSWLPEEYEPAMRGVGGAPTYQLNDPSTWVRRGYTNLNTGQPIAAPAERPGALPASVPSDFAPAGYVPQQAIAPSYEAPAPSTISPGIYQNSFSLASHKPSYTPAAPRAMPSRQERRGSVSSSPYSPRSRPAMAPSMSGVFRGPSGSRRGSGGASEPSDQERDVQMGEGGEEEGLPSAGIRGFHTGPFEGVLPQNAGEANTNVQ